MGVVLMLCDNCSIDIKFGHRCRSNENSCIDEKSCPDYVNGCNCKDCNYLTINNQDFKEYNNE